MYLIINLNKHFFLKILFITIGIIIAVQIPIAIYTWLYVPTINSLEKKDQLYSKQILFIN